MTMNMYYSFQIHDRLGVYSLMLRMGRLFQQYVVTVYCSIELNSMDYIRHKKKDIRNEYLSILYDAIDRGDQIGADVGSMTILSASFTGGPCYMCSHYLDALAICRVYGNPQFFLSHLPIMLNGQRSLVLYKIEFQKRGLPHCHTLLWVHSPPLSPINQRIDDYKSAELPDLRTDPVGYAVICATMMHGPCGLAKSSAPCMELSACSKKFPKLYNSKTYFEVDGRAHYRRRNTGIYTTRGGVKLDNSYVVPYNLLLCLTFHAHINVEFYGWTMLIKYLFKYMSKGTDRVAARITRHVVNTGAQQSQAPKAINEIQNFIDAHIICPHEACWRIFNFPIHHREPAVQILGYDGNKCWKQRANLKKPCIGRLTYIHLAFREAFFLENAPLHQKGCKSFADIRTVNNIVHSTYRSTCEAIGLLGDDKEWSTALEEASVSASSSELR
ncbi:uncharacterized protein [Rutidosis leptorrhynchoides]|uniref:uncharacterized protein n=1 Tax=Rutidosis leptorrhynchoides TaxID=125765 RepID=UPI003A98D4AA